MRLAVAQDVFLEECRNLHDRHDLAFAHQPFAFIHVLNAVRHHCRRRVVDHLRDLARERGVVLIQHCDRNVARHALVEQQGEERERHDGQHEHQHEIHRLVREARQFPPQNGIGITQEIQHALSYFPIRSQSTSTLIPGRMFSICVVGLALTAKVRMSKPPCVRVADHVAKSACTAI